MMLGNMGEAGRRLGRIGNDASPLERADDFYRAQYGSSTNSDGQGDEHGSGFDPLRLFYYLLQYRWLILGMAVLGIVAGMVFTLMQTRNTRPLRASRSSFRPPRFSTTCRSSRKALTFAPF